MSRYIDADELWNNRPKLPLHMSIKAVEGFQYSSRMFAEQIKKQVNNSSADIVAVVRCKDCRYCEEAHYEEEGENPYIKLKCKWSNYSHQPNDYCSNGERREE